MSFLGGHWHPCFGYLVTSPLGFKARVSSALFAFCRGECNVRSPRSTSGAARTNLLAAGSTFYVQCWFDSNLFLPEMYILCKKCSLETSLLQPHLLLMSLQFTDKLLYDN